jgi:hypothetical protein
VQAGGNTYLVIQHDALEAMPTVIGLPATHAPLPAAAPGRRLWRQSFGPS